jgi:ribonuclease P/MRP protein subunit POP1
LEARRQDNRVPVLLIQRSLEASKTTGGHAIHGWTLIIPSGWGMAFWPSFVFTGTRVAGQRERQTQAYEAGTAYFPRDYPFSSAYEEFSKAKEAEMKASWDRKPPAKRTNFQKLDMEDPFSPHWDETMGIRSAEEKGALVSTQREPQSGDAEVKPWLLRGPEVAKIIHTLSSTAIPAEMLEKEMNTLRERRSLGHLVITPRALLQGGLVVVKVNVCTRGLPQDLALIYSLDDEEVKRALISAKRKEPSGEEEENEVS